MKKLSKPCTYSACPMIKKMVKFEFDHVSYITTEHAYVIPLRGSAVISFDNEKFLASPGTVIHGCPQKELLITPCKGQDPFWYLCLYYKPADKLLFNKNKVFSFDIQQNISEKKQLLAVIQTTCPASCRYAEQVYNALDIISGAEVVCPELEPVIEYLHRNFRQPVTLEGLAERFGTTPFSLSYQFKKIIGLRPIEYLIRQRLYTACALLKEGSPVAAAAFEVGYNDPFYFSRLFKKHMGIAPREYFDTQQPAVGS